MYGQTSVRRASDGYVAVVEKNGADAERRDAVSRDGRNGEGGNVIVLHVCNGRESETRALKTSHGRSGRLGLCYNPMRAAASPVADGRGT